MPSLDDILYSLRYQIITPMVTTMGPCSTEGCENHARGSGECVGCLKKRLVELIPSKGGWADCYVHALKSAQGFSTDAEEWAQTIRKLAKEKRSEV